MFHLYGLQGRVFSGTLEQWRATAPVRPASRVRPLSGAVDEGAAGAAPHPSAAARAALGAYASGQGASERSPLTRVAQVMRQPAHCLGSDATVREAWQTLLREGIGQAPVVAADGTLVGLVGRAELLPPAPLAQALADPAAWQALLAQPVRAVMWSPVPAALPDTDLRRVAEVLLASGLPGLPVSSAEGRVLGFVSRSDLLRAIVADPPLDLWS
jgi:CBS domain-containing protein